MCTKSTPPASSAMSTKVARSLSKYRHSKNGAIYSKYSHSKCDADEGSARSLHLAKWGRREGPAPPTGMGREPLDPPTVAAYYYCCLVLQ